MVVSNVQKFNGESVNAISYELAAATNTLNHYGIFSPLGDWMKFAFANIEGLVAVPDYVAELTNDSYIDSQSDAALQELYAIIATIFSQAQNIPPCQNLNNSMNAFISTVTTNITNALNFMKTGFSADTSNELSVMKSTYLVFHNNITDCSKLRPLPNCTSCMLDLARKS